jgi:Icc-related predicted phosphoesterase
MSEFAVESALCAETQSGMGNFHGRFADVSAASAFIVKMLFVADLHYALKQFDWLMASAARFDVVVIGGDLLDLGSDLPIDVQIIVVEKYLRRLRERTRLLVSSGNHDGDHRLATNESICHWLHEVKDGQLFVDGDSVEINGTLISICPWWDGPSTRAEIDKQLAQDAARVKSKWIWINHSPPDKSPVSWAGKKFGGDEFLVEWIQHYQPDLVLSGHIHNAPFIQHGSWIDRLGKTWVFNPGKQIGPNPTYLAFDFDRMSVDWVSLEGQVMQQLDIPVGQFNVTADAAGGA